MTPKLLPNTTIIGLCGAKRSGKDTAKAYFQQVLEGSVFVTRFSRALKEMVLTSPMVRLLKLETTPDWKSLTDDEFETTIETTIKADPEKEEIFRILCQSVGTEVIRSIDPGWHCKRLLESLPTNANYIIIPDIRFANEAQCLVDNFQNVLIIHLDNTKQPDYVPDTHASEAGIPVEYISLTVNSNSTLSVLMEELEQVVPAIEGYVHLHNFGGL